MDTWGTINLNIQEYERPQIDIKLQEVELITDPSSIQPQTVLMGGGRRRKTRSVRGYAPKVDYDAMEVDMLTLVSRTVTFSDGFSITALISELSGHKQLGNDYVWYTCTFVEV